MADHFVLHRWPRDEPRLTLVAATPPQEVRDLVADYRTALARTQPTDMVSLIPADWLHITVHPLAWSADIDAEDYRRFVRELAAEVADMVYEPLVLDPAQGGYTDAAIPLQQTGVVKFPAGWAINFAERFLGHVEPSPITRPHLDIAYYRGDDVSDHRPLAAVAARHDDQPVLWPVHELALVDMVQDVERGYYRWTVRDILDVPQA